MIHHRCIDLKIPQRRYRLAFASVAGWKVIKTTPCNPSKMAKVRRAACAGNGGYRSDGDLSISCERLSPIVFCKCRRSMSTAALERMEDRTPTPLIWDRFAIMIGRCQ
jgi:hypothetical protein